MTSSTQVPTKGPARQVIHLTKEQYESLEKQLPNSHISDSTSPHVVAHKLGVQLVLRLLREGFVV